MAIAGMSKGLARMSRVCPHQFSAFKDRRRLFFSLSHDIQTRLADALRRRGKASMALAGGSTPAPLYEALSHASLAWDKVSITLTDERWVSPSDPASNEHLIRNILIKDRAAGAVFCPFKTKHARASGGASVTERRIARIVPFDVCLIGMGADGHIASLFPAADGYEAAMDPQATCKVAVIHAPGAAGAAERLSLTLSGLLSSRQIVALFMGQDKFDVYREARAGVGRSPLRNLLAQDEVPVHVFWAP